jgi:hypothetical protein
MWLVEVAISAQLPVGWTQCAGGYYWNAACGLVMWEHPQEAFVCGVAARLTAERERAITENVAVSGTTVVATE